MLGDHPIELRLLDMYGMLLMCTVLISTLHCLTCVYS